MTQVNFVVSATDKASKIFDRVGKKMAGLKSHTKTINNSLSTISGSFGGLGISAGAGFAAVGYGLTSLVSNVFKVSSEFEGMQATLEAIEGSSEKAKVGLGWVKDFSATTPYELKEVQESFVRMRAYGIDPINGSLKSAGDAAAALGKPLMAATEAIADAMTGENERLKEFGIRSSKAGDQVTYTWVKNGKDVSKTVDKTNSALVQSTIQAIWNDKYGGAMDKMSKTWSGMASNLKDSITSFYASIGDAGVFAASKEKLASFLSVLSSPEGKKSVTGLADAIGGKLNEALSVFMNMTGLAGGSASGLTSGIDRLAQYIKTIDVKDKISQLVSFGRAIASIAAGLAVAMGVMAKIGNFVGWDNLVFGGIALKIAPALPAILTLGRSLLGLTGTIVRFGATAIIAIGPVGWAIAAVAASAYLIYRNWGAISTFFSGVWASVKTVFSSSMTAVVSVVSVGWASITGSVVGAKQVIISALMSIGASFFNFLTTPIQVAISAINMLIKGFSSLSGMSIPSMPSMPAMAAGAVRSGVQPKLNYGGKSMLEVMVKTQTGTTAIVTPKSNTPMKVNTGKTNK